MHAGLCHRALVHRYVHLPPSELLTSNDDLTDEVTSWGEVAYCTLPCILALAYSALPVAVSVWTGVSRGNAVLDRIWYYKQK